MFGLRLRQLRSERGIKLRELAELLGRSPTYLSQLERGQRWRDRLPPMDDLAAIANLLGVSLEELVGDGEALGDAGHVEDVAPADPNLPAPVEHRTASDSPPDIGMRQDDQRTDIEGEDGESTFEGYGDPRMHAMAVRLVRAQRALEAERVRVADLARHLIDYMRQPGIIEAPNRRRLTVINSAAVRNNPALVGALDAALDVDAAKCARARRPAAYVVSGWYLIRRYIIPGDVLIVDQANTRPHYGDLTVIRLGQSLIVREARASPGGQFSFHSLARQILPPFDSTEGGHEIVGVVVGQELLGDRTGRIRPMPDH